MIKGYSHKPMGTVALGTHLGNFSKEDSLKYVEAIKYAVRNGIYSIDGAINYRGMCSERDEGVALAELINSGVITREEVFILLSFKLDAPSPCRLDAPDLDLICYASADCLHQHLQVI